MVYVGNEPSTSFATVVKDSFSGDGSTVAFTLSKVATTNSVSVFVENVRQEPTTAYAVSGTTLTFTAAPVTSSGNNIYVLHMNPTTTTTHPSAQNLTAVNGTLTGTLGVTGASTLTGNVALGGTLDMNGAELVLDADADTSITADTDDTIDIKIGGSDIFQMTASKLDINGKELILDADGDSSIHSSTDDQIDIKVGNVDKIIVTGNGDISLGGNTPNTYSGYTAITVGGSASTAGTTIDFEDSDANRDFQVYARSEGLYLSGNDVIVETGDIVFAASGKGINLGVTSNTDSNTLDDYEEGTFTFGSNANIGFVSNSNVGKYTKIGRMVHLQYHIDLSSVSSTNHFYMSGMPFTAGSTTSGTYNGDSTGTCMIYNLNTYYTGSQFCSYISNGSSNMYFYETYDNVNWSIVTNSRITSSSEIFVSHTYFV